jgi:hypothetical protein
LATDSKVQLRWFLNLATKLWTNDYRKLQYKIVSSNSLSFSCTRQAKLEHYLKKSGKGREEGSLACPKS